MNVDALTSWYWTNDTEITTLQLQDIDNDGNYEIITGGYFNDHTRDIAQLVVWDSENLTPLRLTSWYWTGNTRINSIDIKNIDDEPTKEIITGGYYTDTVKNAQLVTWDANTLTPKNIATWYWTNNTEILSLKAENIDNDETIEIVTGGYYFDGTRKVAQLVNWNAETLSPENVKVWYWTNDTQINSIEIGDIDYDDSIEIITGGYYNDFSRDVAQLVVWDGSSLEVDHLQTWYWTADTTINSVFLGDVDGDSGNEIITGGFFNDIIRNNSQVTIWQIK